jgi:hypothetical protein
MATNLTSIPPREFERLADEIDRHGGLNDVLAWAAGKPKTELHSRIVLEVVTQDEFTHDIIVPYRDLFLVYDTT